MSKQYVKLKNVGDDVTFTVTRCAPGTGKYPDVEFEDASGHVYPVPKSAADRQFDRIGRTPDTVVGDTVRISRSENKQDASKPYWNIELLSSGAAKPKGGAATAATSDGAASASQSKTDLKTSGTTPAAQPEKPSVLYEQVTDWVLANILPKMKAAGVPVTHEGISAQIATVYIAARDR